MKNQIARIVKAAALIAACGLAGLAAPKQVVTVGTEGVYAPFTFLDDKGVLTGYNVEVVREIARRVNLEVKFVPTPWDSMFLALDSRKFDMIVVTHEMAFAQEVANHVAFMDGGVVVEEGTPREVFEHTRQERTRNFLQRVRRDTVAH
jgi:ABC-type amino acid transport substrate-binding protein